jgi:hypothetical protein
MSSGLYFISRRFSFWKLAKSSAPCGDTWRDVAEGGANL